MKAILKPTISLILILTVIGGSMALIKNRQHTAVVSINDDGFQPQKLIVQEGTTVVFKNIGNSQHWPASNFHPTHALYPEAGGCIDSKLDACLGLKPGETFSFLFKIPGTWPVHDHLFPGMTMIIEVTNGPTSATDRISTHAADFEKQGLPESSQFRTLDYSSQLDLINAASIKDPVSAWQYLKAAFLVDGRVVGNAHEFAHIIGNKIYDHMGLQGIVNCDETFAYGCYHGITEKLLQDKGPQVVKNVQDECLKIFPPEVTHNYTGCIHGMGHGLLTFQAFNIKDALKDCDGLDHSYRPFCYDGVFMENSMDNPTAAYDANDPWRLCKNLPEQYHYNCGRYQSLILRQEFGTDLNKTAIACAKAPNDTMKNPCFESLGFFVAQTSFGEVQKMNDLCHSIKNGEVTDICLIAAAKETIFQKYENWEEVSDQLCELVATKLRSECLNSNQEVKKTYRR